MNDWMKSYWQGLRHSIGTYGELGFHVEGISFRKAIKQAYDFKTDAEVEAKLHEFEFGVKQIQKAKLLEAERRKRMEERHRSKIIIKRKGEESYQLGKKKKTEPET
jgi:hypothetical protein